MNRVLMLNFSKYAMVVVLIIVVSIGFPSSAQANRRATKEQIAKRAQESESLWNAPGSNYAAISSIFIQPGTMQREDVLKRLTPALDQAGRTRRERPHPGLSAAQGIADRLRGEGPDGPFPARSRRAGRTRGYSLRGTLGPGAGSNRKTLAALSWNTACQCSLGMAFLKAATIGAILASGQSVPNMSLAGFST